MTVKGRLRRRLGSSAALLAIVWETTGLEPGEHTVRITVTGDKNPASTNTWVGLDAIIVTPDPDRPGRRNT